MEYTVGHVNAFKVAFALAKFQPLQQHLLVPRFLYSLNSIYIVEYNHLVFLADILHFPSGHKAISGMMKMTVFSEEKNIV